MQKFNPVFCFLFLLMMVTTKLQADPDEFNLSDHSEIFAIGKIGQTEYFLQDIHFDIGTSNYMGVILLRTANDRPNISFGVDEDGRLLDDAGNEMKIPSVVQVMYHGINCGHMDADDVKLTGKELKVEYSPGVGRYETPSRITDVWKWKGNAFVLDSHKKVVPYDDLKAEYHSLLKKGDFAAARTLGLEDSPNGGWTCLGDEYNTAYLQAAKAAAKKQYDQGARFEAGLTAMQALLFPPHYYCDDAEADKFISWTKRGEAPTGEKGAAPICNRIPNTDKNIVVLNDLAWYLHQAGFAKESVAFFERVIAARPNRVVAHLNLADARWDSGAEYTSRKHYQRYLELLKELMPGKTPVKRAVERTKN